MWIAGLLLLLQQVDLPDLRMDQQGQTINVVKHDYYSLPGSSMIDIVKFHQLLNDLDRRIYQAPVNAEIDNHERIISERTDYNANNIDRSYNIALAAKTIN